MTEKKIATRRKWIIRAHRCCSWLLVFFSIWTIYTGYSAARDWTQDVQKMTNSHVRMECFFLLFFALHVVLTGLYFKSNWKIILKGLKSNRGRRVNFLRLVQNLTAWLIIITAVFVVGSGMVDPDIASLQVPCIDPWELHRFYDIFLSLVIVIHTSVGLRFFLMRRRVNRTHADTLTLLTCIVALGVVMCLG